MTEINILNLMGRGYLDFFIEQDTSPSHPVPTLEKKDDIRHPNLDAEMLAGW